MKITFIKDCPPLVPSGNSAYKVGDKADLPRGKQLIELGYAREGWEPLPKEEPEPTLKPATKPKRGKRSK